LASEAAKKSSTLFEITNFPIRDVNVDVKWRDSLREDVCPIRRIRRRVYEI
jgi:hypothetical protein